MAKSSGTRLDRAWEPEAEPQGGAKQGLLASAAVALPAATEAMREAAVETVWRNRRRGRINQFPISDNLLALMALVMADLSETQRETLMNLIYQRDIALTDLTLHQLRDFLITLSHAPKSSLENPSWSAQDHSFPFHMVNLTSMKDIGYLTRRLEMKVSLDEHEDLFWVYDEDQCF